MALEGMGSGGGTYGGSFGAFAKKTAAAPVTHGILRSDRNTFGVLKSDANPTPYNRPAAVSEPTPIPQPAPAPVPAAAAPAPAPAPPAPPPMSLDDFIKSNFLYTAEQNEGGRRLDDFDSETLRMQQETKADQDLRRAALGRRLDDAGQGNAEDMAGRGLLRSGLTFQNQDKIDESGVEQGNLIEQLLTNLVSDRGQGRVNQQAQNRSALNDRIAQLTEQFNQKQTQAA